MGTRRCGRDDRGSSAVSFALVLPMLAVFLCCTVDLGRTVLLHMALADASHAVCREAVSGIDAGETYASGSWLERAACEAAPLLAASDVRVSASATCGERSMRSYDHHVYDEARGEFATRAVGTASRPVTATVTVEGRYATPIGALVAAACGDAGGTFSFSAQTAGTQDLTVAG